MTVSRMERLITSMNGLGDNIFQRPFVQSLLDRGDKIWITTPWPEVYDGMDVSFVRSSTSLRTQIKNQSRYSESFWSKWPPTAVVTRASYGAKELSYGSIFDAMRRGFGVEPSRMSLPSFHSPITGDYAVVRPVTARKEWCNLSRNPYPEYIETASKMLLDTGIKVISVADLEQDKEWIVGKEPPATVQFHRGELDCRSLLGLIRHAKCVVGGVGWIVPASIAYGVPLFCVLGGNGRHNHPSKISDRAMELNKVRWAIPDRHCMCALMNHNCDKEISNFEWQFRSFLYHHGLYIH